MEPQVLNKRKLPKLMACMTKNSLENLRNKALFSIHMMDFKGIRRTKKALHECIILELKEAGFNESSEYLQDLIYDNIQLLEQDEIGIVVDLRKKNDYLEHIGIRLQKAEKERDKQNTKREALILLNLALEYAENGKGILWLAEKFFLAAIAVSSQYMIDGGRQKCCCKYHYAKFLLDKFPEADPEEPFNILTEVRDSATGKLWPLDEPDTVEGQGDQSQEKKEDRLLFIATAEELHRVLLSKARSIRLEDPSKAERLCRLAERRAIDAKATTKTAEAIIEIGICQLRMNSLNNARKTFERAFKIHTDNKNIAGLCDVRMHMAAVMQKFGDFDNAARLLTEMGSLAMDHGLRRHLGRALHLLGELHLRREKPELGTHHLKEAFYCFMGYSWQTLNGVDTLEYYNQKAPEMQREEFGHLEVICHKETVYKYVDEAEQSRFMMGISAGQERMTSYFDLIREARRCGVAKIKVIEWKLSRAGWWNKRQHHDFWPCVCPVHNRTPLDILRMKLALDKNNKMEEEDHQASLGRADTLPDIQQLHSSYMPFHKTK